MVTLADMQETLIKKKNIVWSIVDWSLSKNKTEIKFMDYCIHNLLAWLFCLRFLHSRMPL